MEVGIESSEPENSFDCCGVKGAMSTGVGRASGRGSWHIASVKGAVGFGDSVTVKF